MKTVFVLLFTGCMVLAGQNKSEIVPETQCEFLPDTFSHHWSYRTKIDLAGRWQFRLDSNEIGETEKWQNLNVNFSGKVTIPGAPQAQGYGAGNYQQKNLFWDEAFWVKRKFSLPEFRSQRAWLRIGGILPAAKVYINGHYIGYTKSSRTQQRVDITDFLKLGCENEITIKVCKLPEIRLDGMYEWVTLGLTWTGIYRPISIELAPEVSILSAHVIPDIDSASVLVDYTLSASPRTDLNAQFSIYDEQQELTSLLTEIPAGSLAGSVKIPFKNYQTWSHNHPDLYTLNAALVDAENNQVDCVGIKFGMRKIETAGERFLLNNKPLYLRCFGDMALYADTLSPPADVNWYLPKLAQAKKYGMNAIKCCVDTMTEEFLEAADTMGIMVIQEMPFGVGALRANRYTIDEKFRDFYAKELEGIVITSRNHPSVIAYSMSSELSFPENVTQESFDFFSKDMPKKAKKLAPNNLVIDCTGYVDTLETVKGTRVTDFYASIHPKWLKIVLDDANMVTDHKRPLILHEYNWWGSYPDPADRKKYTDSQLKPFWLDTLVRTAHKNGQGELIQTYTTNSRWLQWLCQKDGLEYARRKKDIQGFIFWSMIDYFRYNEGILDDFWNPKQIASKEFLMSNGDTVIVLAKDGNRCFAADSVISILLAISNYSENLFVNPVLKWNISEFQQKGKIAIENLPQGELTSLEPVKIHLPNSYQPHKFEFEVELADDNGKINTNHWSFWMFPKVCPEISEISSGDKAGMIIRDNIFIRTGKARNVDIPSKVSLVLSDGADDKLANFLERGGSCILIGRGIPIENKICYHEATTFYTLFRTVPWNGGDSGNSGTIISHHPALYNYPHEGRCDLQFLSMIQGILPMHFEPLRKYGLNTPIIRTIDHYLSNRNNAYMLEFRVGEGKVLATTLGILSNWKSDESNGNWGSQKLTFGPNQKIEALYLLNCLLEYGHSDLFEPVAAIPKYEFVKQFEAWRSSGNILTNGGFELGDLSESADNAENKPGRWHMVSDPNFDVYKWGLSKSKSYTGKQCLNLKFNEAKDANCSEKEIEKQSSLCIYNDSTEFGKNYNDIIFEGWLNLEELNDDMICEISISCYRKLYKDKIEMVGGEKGWKSFKLNLGKTVRLSTIGDLEVKISVTLTNNQLNTGGIAYFDDFELKYVYME